MASACAAEVEAKSVDAAVELAGSAEPDVGDAAVVAVDFACSFEPDAEASADALCPAAAAAAFTAPAAAGRASGSA